MGSTLFPLTSRPVWGGDSTWSDPAAWQATMSFSHGKCVIQEIVPSIISLNAVLELSGTDGRYLLSFPGGTRTVIVSKGSLNQDVASLLCKGKHLYRIEGPAGGKFNAIIHMSARIQIVPVRDEGYVNTWRTISEAWRQRNPGDRTADRVGSWTGWIKSCPVDFDETQTRQARPLKNGWRFLAQHNPLWEDKSGFNIDDSSWLKTDLPQTDLNVKIDSGYIWYRNTFSVPLAWRGRKVLLRWKGCGDAALVFINGHEVGSATGQAGGFQFEIGDYLKPESENLVAIRVWPVADGAGLAGYPEISLASQFGFSLQGRLFPGKEGAVRISFRGMPESGATGGSFGFGRLSSSLYRPPEIRFKSLQAAGGQVLDVQASADHDMDALYCRCTARRSKLFDILVFFDREALGAKELNLDIDKQKVARLSVLADTVYSLGIIAPGNAGMEMVQKPDGILLTIHYSSTGNDEKTISIFKDAGTDSKRATGLDAALQTWEKKVYSVARPLVMNHAQAAAWRSYKQTVTLNARMVESDKFPGLLAAFDKPIFHVYWMRDMCISIPGAVYAGGKAQATALAACSDTLREYTKVPEAQGIFPDGTIMGGSNSDGPALCIGAHTYAWSLLGDAWLKEHADTVWKYLEYLVDLDQKGKDAPDGIIRCSVGDWKDVTSMKRFKCAGASFFVNMCYIQALRDGTALARALGLAGQAERYASIRRMALKNVNLDVEDGGYWMPDRGYYADSIQPPEQRSWVFPKDKDQTSVFAAFETAGHALAILEGVIPADRLGSVLRKIDEFGIMLPVPGVSRYPFYDVLRHIGWDGLAEAHPLADLVAVSEDFRAKLAGKPSVLTPDMLLPWKGWPGNHNWGGRWQMVGAQMLRAVWHVGTGNRRWRARADVYRAAMEKAMRRSRSAGRCFETESYGAISREESGCHTDPSGYYQLWSGAVSLQAIVEGRYGARTTGRGADLALLSCAVGDGLSRLPIAGGEVSYRRLGTGSFQIDVDTAEPGELRILDPGRLKPAKGKSIQWKLDEEGNLVLAYGPGLTRMVLALEPA